MDTEKLELYKNCFQGFSKKSHSERLALLESLGLLSKSRRKLLNKTGAMDLSLAEKFIENVLGYYQMPMGVATNFVIDGKPYVVPMVVEETSIIAAASKTAKWVRDQGLLTTQVEGQDIIGQIQMSKVKNLEKLKSVVRENENKFVELANEHVAAGLVRRGGGVRSLSLRTLERPDGGTMGVIHVAMNACDAMGANVINQVCEYLKPVIEVDTGETVTMCILSNLVDSKVTKARVEMSGVDSELIDKIEEASLFAQLDPYRAATNNKGVLNGIDPILIATGNDWRAVEAGVHAYVSREGVYTSLTRWRREGSLLVGEFEAPIIVGVVGGMTRLHPMAQMSLEIMNIESAEDLSRVCAAVGLVQNLGALKALTTVGIIEGHMRLHIKNLTLEAGAKDQEVNILQRRLEKILNKTKRISPSVAHEELALIRRSQAQL